LQHAKDEANDDVVKIIEEICANAGDDKGLADKDGIRKRK
jgi:hypothetical protein